MKKKAKINEYFSIHGKNRSPLLTNKFDLS